MDRAENSKKSAWIKNKNGLFLSGLIFIWLFFER